MTAPGGSGRNVKIVISADVAQAIRALGQTQQALGGVSGQADQTARSTRTMGDVMKGTLAASGIQAGISGIVDGFKGMVNSGLEYERNMNTFSAVTQASAAQMQQMGDTAKQLGADVKIPGASAQSAAAAMTELAKGGLTADQAMQAARGTMILAAAAQVDGAQAAEIQANALNTFGLKADQAGRVANVLANVANKSSGEITDFSQALAAGGTVASSFGWSIEDTTTALGLMANAGIKGSDAGTSLKAALTYLLNPSKEAAAAQEKLGIVTHDANGQMISARELTADLAAAKGRMTEAEYNQLVAQALGQDAVRTGIVLGQAATTGYDEMATALGNVNGAQDVAAANSKGLSGVIDALKNTVDTASLALFEQLQPSIMQVAQAATGLVTPLASALTPALGAVADLATGTLAPALTGVTGVIAAIVEPLSSVIGWFSDLPSPIGTAVLALGGVIALRGPLVGTFTSAAGSLSTLLATLRGTAGAAAAGSAGFAGWIASLRAATGAAATFGVVAKGAFSLLGGGLGLAIIGATTALSLFSSTSDDAATSTEGLNQAIDEQTGKLAGNAAQIIATEAANSGASAAYERLGGNVSDYVDALGGVPGAQEKVNAKIAESRAAYDEQQKAIQNASQGTAGFAGAQVAAADASGKAIPSIQDLNKATDFLTQSQGALAGKTDAVRLANAGAAGELAKTGEATKDLGNQASTAAEKTTPFSDALKDIRSAAAEADANAQFLSITLLRMAGNTIPAEQQARANAAAFRAIGQASRDLSDANDTVAKKQAEYDRIAAHLGSTLDGQEASATNLVITQADVERAARDVADAQASVDDATDKLKDTQDKAAVSATDQAAAAYENAKANGQTLTQAVDAAVAKITEQRKQFVESATDAHTSEQAAEDLATAQGLIPENVRTHYEQIAVQDAIDKADELNRKLSDLDKKEYYYKVVGTEVQKFVTGSYAPEDLHAEGGFITGPGTGTSDSIRARLSNGEFVVRASQTAKHRDTLEMINTPGFAEGGLVSNKVTGKFEQADWGAGLGRIIGSFDKIMKEKLLSFGISGGLNPSQDPSSFGWQRGAGIVPFSWNGTAISGGVAGGTQNLWAGLLSALVPNIPGGLTGPIWGYENRNIAGSSNASFHSYGLAIDVNAPQNGRGLPGYGRSGTGVIPGDLAHSLAARFGMEWGGDWSYTDPMHFEIHVSPGQIGAGGSINLGGGGAAPGGSGVERWRNTVLQALSITGQSPSWANAVLKQMNSESSGNERAVNTWDRNFPLYGGSKGLMQVIPPTFARYALPGYNTDIFDPLSNVVASIRYVLGTYPEGLARFNRAQAYDNGGILPPGFTMAYNGTGQNEAIFTGQQFNAMAAQAVPSVNMTPRIEITNYVDVDGMLARTEVMVDGKLAQVERSINVALASS